MLRLAVDNTARPRTRGECIDGPRPCPWVSCRYHLEHAEESCALDVADRGPQTQEEVGRLFGLTQKAIFEIERKAVAKLSRRADVKQLRSSLGRTVPDVPLTRMVLDSITFRPATLSELEERLNIEHERLRLALRDLRRDGRLACVGSGPDAVWATQGIEEAA